MDNNNTFMGPKHGYTILIKLRQGVQNTKYSRYSDVIRISQRGNPEGEPRGGGQA